MTMRWPILFVLITLLGSCASTPGVWRVGEPSRSCVDIFDMVDRAVDEARTADAEYGRIKGFPYFRIDRFLASYNFAGLDAAQRTDWINRLVANDLEARRIELDNLPNQQRHRLGVRLGADPVDTVNRCSSVLRTNDHEQPAAHKALPQRATVGDHYSGLKRALGLYPFTAPFVKRGFSAWKRENLGVFDVEASDIPVRGHLNVYGPQSHVSHTPKDIRALVDSTRSGGLDIPDPTGAAAEALVDAFAPVWVIDTVSDNDFPGTPVWAHSQSQTATIDTRQPRTYTRFSHVHWNGHVLLQINYMIWFPARPAEGKSDSEAGHIDGLIWRVTLAADGTPLVYDSIHPCGCYHLFFPSTQVQFNAKMAGSTWYEGTMIAATAPEITKGQRVAVRMAAGNHYIQNVSAWDGHGPHQPYTMASYHDLRSLPFGSARKSLFGPSGLVAGTERGERRYLWVTGIKSPGAMRQWGNHATAFVGKRHFDDPWLIMRNFGSVASRGSAP